MNSEVTSHLLFAIIASTLGSAFQHGYNTGVVNAPQQVIERFISDSYENGTPSDSTVTLIFSIIVSIYCLGGMIGAMWTSFVGEKLGRKGALLWNNVFVFIAAALMGLSKLVRNYEMFIVGRFVIGFNSGLSAGLVPIYLTEISPVSLRGAVGTIYQLVIVISILLSQILGLPQILGNDTEWPFLFGLIILPAIFMLLTLPSCPESPKFLLIIKNEEDAAVEALEWFRGTTEVEDEVKEMKHEFEEMRKIPKVTYKEMCTNAMLRKPLIISVVIMLSQQFSGINAVIYYSTKIFMSAGLTSDSAIYATLGMGTVNFLMTIASMALVDKVGRKTLHMVGLSGMMFLTATLTISISKTPTFPLASAISVMCVIGIIIAFATGPGSIPWFLVAELFGQGSRPLATSIAVTVNWMANFIVSIAFLPISDAIGEYVFLIFTVLLAMFLLFTYFKVPETRNRTIEDITSEFREEKT